MLGEMVGREGEDGARGRDCRCRAAQCGQFHAFYIHLCDGRRCHGDAIDPAAVNANTGSLITYTRADTPTLAKYNEFVAFACGGGQDADAIAFGRRQ
jgi:hypothetical protein